MKRILVYSYRRNASYNALTLSLLREGRRRGWRFVWLPPSEAKDEPERVARIFEIVKPVGIVSNEILAIESILPPGFPVVLVDCPRRTYSASVLHNGAYLPLVQSDNPSILQSVNQSVNRTHFPLAAPAKSLSAVEFLGEGAFTSLLGEWAQKANGTRIQLR